jgi:hypothetical protein
MGQPRTDFCVMDGDPVMANSSPEFVGMLELTGTNFFFFSRSTLKEMREKKTVLY